MTLSQTEKDILRWYAALVLVCPLTSWVMWFFLDNWVPLWPLPLLLLGGVTFWSAVCLVYRIIGVLFNLK